MGARPGSKWRTLWNEVGRRIELSLPSKKNGIVVENYRVIITMLNEWVDLANDREDVSDYRVYMTLRNLLICTY